MSTRTYSPNAKHTALGVTVRPALKFRNPFTPAHHAQVLQEALKLAAQDIYVVPLHAPLFNNAGALVGCTCEANKRSKSYQRWLKAKHAEGQCLHLKYDPAFKCPTPGKHPRLADWEEQASIDPAIIRGWFARYDKLNLGIAPGKSGLLVLDADKYKDNYAGATLLSQNDEQTATMLTGNGGQHFYYQMPAGATYGNDTGELPDGIDIRGYGGQVVVYPSIHPNGNQYQWEDGYSIFECQPLPLPEALQSILEAAHGKKALAHAIKFTTPTTESPQLGQWHLSKAAKNLIFNPATVGQRSEADMKVVTSLVYEGATDDDILAVFEHYPIGVNGKFAEAGRGYLAHTIGKARAFADANPRPDVVATVALIRLWIRTHSFEGFVPSSSDGIYRTDATDTKIADAMLDAMIEANRLKIVIGKKWLGKLAGVSCNTAQSTLLRLNGFLFDVTPDNLGARVSLVEKCRLHQIDPSLTIISVTTRDQSSENDKSTGVINEYSPRKADDAFLTGTSRHVKRQMKDVATTLDITDREALEQFTFKGLGESGLRVIDAMLRAGDMTAQELADETGKKLSAIQAACRRLVKHGLLDATREGSRGPKVYNLANDLWERLEAVAPDLRTYKLSSQRENKRLECAQAWTKTEIVKAESAGDTEQAVKLERRFAKQAKTRIAHLERLHPDLSAKDIERLAYEVAAYKRSPKAEAAVKTARQLAQDDHALTVACIINCLTNYANQTGRLPAMPTGEDTTVTIEGQTFERAMIADVLRNPALVKRTMQGVEEVYAQAEIVSA